MRNFLLLLLAFWCLPAVVAGCTGQGGTVLIPTAVHQVSTLKGEGTIGSLYVGAYPFTYAIRWRGEGRLTLQYPQVPHILLEGSLTWEPVVPEHAPGIAAEMAAGRFAVRP